MGGEIGRADRDACDVTEEISRARYWKEDG
jgi:hypothetical protein